MVQHTADSDDKPSNESKETGSGSNEGETGKSVASSRRRERLRAAALNKGPERDAFYLNHPFVCNRLPVLTKPLQDAYKAIEQAIVHRDTGTCFIGEFRLGKSRAIHLINEELKVTFPTVPVVVVNAKHHENSSERTLYGDMLEDWRHGGAFSGTAADRRRRILSFLEAAARSNASDRLLLFIDEGQNWKVNELTYLRDLTNDMQHRNIDVISIIFGNPEILKTRATLSSLRRTDLIGRFLLTPREFRGLRDAQELKHFLKAHDEVSLHEYPLGSGICVSEFFLPIAFNGGWRLAHEFNSMWGAFEQVAGNTGHKAGNIGMQWVCSAVRNFIFSHVNSDNAMFKGQDPAWLLAVQGSGYESSLQN